MPSPHEIKRNPLPKSRKRSGLSSPRSWVAPALFGDIKKKEEARDLDPSNGRSERNLCATSRRDCSTHLSPLLPGTRRVYIVRYYCVTVLVHGGISLSLALVWTSTSRCDVSMGWVWLGSSLKCSWIPLPLSLSGVCSEDV